MLSYWKNVQHSIGKNSCVLLLGMLTMTLITVLSPTERKDLGVRLFISPKARVAQAGKHTNYIRGMPNFENKPKAIAK